MIDFDDLNKLKASQFEKLIKTLLLEVIGKGVTPFSHGKDGAREATFQGKSDYPSKAENWGGHWIFQVKFSDVTLGIDKARDQIKYSINGELKKLEDYGYLSSNQCDNYIYITNVPFSGTAKKGLHDYIANKRQSYKIKNFDYWDSEKVLALINTHSTIRDTFFPIDGVEFLSEKELDEVQDYFVKPNCYDELKNKLLHSKVLSIIGQPHVGKSSLAIHLAGDILNSEKCLNAFVIPLIEGLNKVPKIENGVIIFDDLFGDINYESIGRKTKVINSLSKHNFVIVTSREHIYRDAESNSETYLFSDDLTINQEGAYTDSLLVNILENHLRRNFPRTNLNSNSYDFVLKNGQYIVKHLRYPHNIHVLTEIIDESVVTKKSLIQKIKSANKIEDVVQYWTKSQNKTNQNVLLALSIGRIYDINSLISICKIQWEYSEDTIINCIVENSRIVNFSYPSLRFIHPSYKSAVRNYSLSNNREQIVELVTASISKPENKEKKLIDRSLVYGLFESFTKEQLQTLILNKHIAKNYLEMAWLNLFRLDKKAATSLVLLIKKQSGAKFSRHASSILSGKDFMKDKEIFEIVNYLLTRRKESKAIEHLIVHFSYRLGEKTWNIISPLVVDGSSRDLKLKLKLLGVIGSKNPDSVIDQLTLELDNPYVSTRSTVYTALNMLSSHTGNEKIIKILKEALKNEKNKSNILKIERSIRSREKILKKAANNV